MNAISMPHELGWQRFTCWRCKGTGKLPEDDPYTRRTPQPPPAASMAVLVWWWAYVVCASVAFVILCL
jgi:hypothetical protein